MRCISHRELTPAGAWLKRISAALPMALSRRPWLLIYQMGKAGSQTVEATLRAAGLPHRIRRIHILSPQHNLISNWIRHPGVPEPAKVNLREQMAEAQVIYTAIALRKRWWRMGKLGCKLNVIVGVREPVSMLLASVFQNYSNYFSSVSEITVEACRNLLLGSASKDFRHGLVQDTLAYIHGWFDAELRAVLGVDVYAKPFAHVDGCTVYENAMARVLVYRYEDFARVHNMLESFLGLRLCALVNRNIGVEKDYADSYRLVKQKLRLPDPFLAEQYGSRLARHFYSQEERGKFSARWQAKG